MSSAAKKVDPAYESEARGVVLAPPDEAELVSRIAETDEGIRTGTATPWDDLEEEREARYRLGPDTEPDRSVWRLLCFAERDEVSDEQLRAALPSFSIEQIAAARARVRPFVDAVASMPEPETIDELIAEPCVSVGEAVDAGLCGITREQWDAMLREQCAKSI